MCNFKWKVFLQSPSSKQVHVARVSIRQQESICDISSAKIKLFISFLKGVCCKFHLTFARDISVCSIHKVQSDKAAKKCNTLMQKMFVHAPCMRHHLPNKCHDVSMSCTSAENSRTWIPMKLHIWGKLCERWIAFSTR